MITQVNTLKFNLMSNEKFEEKQANESLVENEIYLTPAPKVDSEPVESSKNLITSGGVFEALKNIPKDEVKPQIQSDWSQTDETAVDYIKNKIGDIYFATITNVYDMSNSDNMGDMYLLESTNRLISYPEQMTFAVRNKETSEETLVGSCQLEFIEMDGMTGMLVSVNTTNTIMELMMGGITSITRTDESIPFAIVGVFSIDADLNMLILSDVDSSNYEIIVNYDGELIKGLPDNILSEEFENNNGILSLALGKTIIRNVEETIGYGTTLGAPNTSPSETMPFHVWDGVFNFVKNVQEGTPITVSFKNNGVEEEIGSCNLITNSVFDAAFGFDPAYTIGYWGLVNGNITMNELLTNPLGWAPLDTNKPTFGVILTKQLSSGHIYVNLSSPYNLSYTGYEISIRLTTTEQHSEVIKLPNEALNLDSMPIENSTNPITSGGVYNALQNIDVGSNAEVSWEDITDKPFEDLRTIFEIPTDGSGTTITSQSVSALDGLQFVFTKVSDIYFNQPDDIIGSTIYVGDSIDSDSYDSYTIIESDIISLSNGYCIMPVDSDAPLCMSISSTGTVTLPTTDYYGEDLVFNVNETGLYLLNITNILVATSYVIGYIKQIDPKFISIDLSNHYTKDEINDLFNNKAEAIHYHSAYDINSGQLSTDYLPVIPITKGGTGQTSIIDTNYTTTRYRASSLHSTETNPTENGTIVWIYE